MASQFSNLLFLDHVLNFTDIMIIHHTGTHGEESSMEQTPTDIMQIAQRNSSAMKGFARC
jgi:carbonic anhydrase